MRCEAVTQGEAQQRLGFEPGVTYELRCRELRPRKTSCTDGITDIKPLVGGSQRYCGQRVLRIFDGVLRTRQCQPYMQNALFLRTWS